MDGPSKFGCDVENRNRNGQRWTKWIEAFDHYLKGSGIIDDDRKISILLHTAGPRVAEIFENIGGDDADSYNAAEILLQEHFNPQKNLDFEKVKFGRSTQQSEESIHDFAARLRGLAELCEFANKEDEIRRQILVGCNSAAVREKALRSEDKSLKYLLNYARTLETSKAQAKSIETMRPPDLRHRADLDEVKGGRMVPRQSKFAKINDKKGCESKCFNCGYEYPHPNDKPCPA